MACNQTTKKGKEIAMKEREKRESHIKQTNEKKIKKQKRKL